MKITITDNRKEAVPNEVYYVGALFANILSMLQTYGLLKNDAVEHTLAPDGFAELEASGKCSECGNEIYFKISQSAAGKA